MERVENTRDLFYKIFKSDLEQHRFEVICVLILVVGCLGGLVVGTGGLTNLFELVFSAFSTVILLSLILAVQPMKIVVKTAIPVITFLFGMLVYNCIMGLPFLNN